VALKKYIYISAPLHFSDIIKLGLKNIMKHSSSSFLESKSRHMRIPLGWTHICATNYIWLPSNNSA